MQVQYEAVYGPKFMTFWDDVYATPCGCQRTYPVVYIIKGVLAPDFRGRCTPDFRHALSNRTLPGMWPVLVEFR